MLVQPQLRERTVNIDFGNFPGGLAFVRGQNDVHHALGDFSIAVGLKPVPPVRIFLREQPDLRYAPFHFGRFGFQRVVHGGQIVAQIDQILVSPLPVVKQGEIFDQVIQCAVRHDLWNSESFKGFGVLI